MMIQLPKSGDWVIAKDIIGVDAQQENRHNPEEFPANVVVSVRHGDRVTYCTIYCASFEEATTTRDLIAAIANRSQEIA